MQRNQKEGEWEGQGAVGAQCVSNRLCPPMRHLVDMQILIREGWGDA